MLEEIVMQYGTGRPPSTLDYLFYAAIGAYLTYAVGREKIQQWGARFADRRDAGDDAIEQLRQEYVDGEITHAQFESRVELLLDDDAQELRTAVERVNGIGPETSAAIAQEFGTIDAVADADRDALEDVHGIGEKTANAVLERS